MTPPCPCDCLNICHRVDPLEQLGVNCCAPGHLQLYTTAKRSLHSLSQHIDFDWDLKLATFQLQVTTSASLFSVFSPGSRSIPGSADRCFQGRWLSGNKSAEIPNLKCSVTGRSNCNRKAIITYSSSGRERFHAP